ncbi:MAG: AraC family transcriptional regulator [Burkholderiaceae bacterium]
MHDGVDEVILGGRHLHIDADTCLLVGPGQRLSSAHGGRSRAALSILVFGPEALAHARSLGEFELGVPADDFLPTLRPRLPTVSRLFERLERRGPAGAHRVSMPPDADVGADGDAGDFQAQLRGLIALLVDAERCLRLRAQAIASVKPSTRRELFRRVLVATDHIHGHYQQRLALDDIAAAACLSRFHLLRLFGQVHGDTPHAYLMRKRRSVALRLLASTRAGLDDIAVQSGFGTRSSLFRHLRSELGAGGQSIRDRVTGRAAHRLVLESFACSTPV